MADLKAMAVHQFLFPFCIRRDESKKFDLAIWEAKHQKKWLKQSLEPSNDNYGVRQYFHNEVSRLLWDRHPNSKDNIALNHYIFATCGGSYEIKVHREEFGTRLDFDYKLDVASNGIQLYILDSLNIGILCFTLSNPDENCTTEDVLRINQWGRRIYWPFVATVNEQSVCYECADEITLSLKQPAGQDIIWQECFSPQNVFKQDYRPKYAEFIEKLLEDIRFYHIIDDRMFTCCFVKSHQANLLANIWQDYTNDPAGYFAAVSNESTPPNMQVAEKDSKAIHRAIIDYWYKLCYVDIGLTCQNARMKADLLINASYNRWSDGGTFYAFTRYSFITLVSPSAPPYLDIHFKQHYHYLSVILLLQRASLISFADEVNYLADEQIICKEGDCREKGFLKHREEALSKLTLFRKRYILFINKVWFDEVSPQEQGIELYELGKRVMGLEQQKEALRGDIEELYQFVKAEESERQSRLLSWLSELGGAIIPLSLWSGLMALSEPTLLYVLLANVLVIVSSMFMLLKKKIQKPEVMVLLYVYIGIAAFRLAYFFFSLAPKLF